MTDRDIVAVLAFHVRRLDTAACAALVADLWAARGFETSRAGNEVVAVGRDATLRIRVGTGAERRASADPPDVVVSTGSGRGTRDAPAGVRVVDAEGLAGMLRYAVDRSTARTLCERHLGAAPGDLRPPATERLRARVRGLRTSQERPEPPVAPAPFLVAVLTLLFVGAVAGVAFTAGPVFSADADGADGADGVAVDALSVPESTPVNDGPVVTATASATPASPPNASVVPGLSDDAIVDLSALAAAHARALLARSYTLWMDSCRSPTDDLDTPPGQFDTDVAVAGDRYLVEESVGDGAARERLRTVYRDGDDWFVANLTADGTTYTHVQARGQAPSPPPNPEDVALTLVADYLSTPETTVEGHTVGDARGAGGPVLYRVVGRGTPPAMGDGVRNYTAVALVDRDGLVRDLRVTHTVVEDGGESGGSYRVREEWTYGNLGETTVAPPDWQAERFGVDAENATGG